MKLERLIAGIVSTIITVSSLSSSFASVAIDTKGADLKNKVNVESLNDYSIEPVNSLGRILETEMLSDENLEQSSEEIKEYGVQNINVEYGKALVAFNTNDNASVIVGLYDEQTGDMITSAAADITPDENYVEVEFDVMPDDYFIAKGYLVDSDTLAPLSEVFENNCYTQEEQEFYSITPEDFDSEKVLLFNKEDKQNFAAFDEKAKIIQYSKGINVLTTNDLENGYYVIENADDEVMNLSPDDIFVMYYGEEIPLIIKVGEVTVNGTTVEIKDTETGIDEVFEFFRLDSGVCEPEFNEEDLLDDTEIVYDTQKMILPEIDILSSEKAAKEDDKVENKNKFDFGIDNTGVAWAKYTKTIKKTFLEGKKEYTNRGGYSVLPNQTGNKINTNAKITGSVSLSIGGELRCSFDKNKTGKKYLKVAINSEIDSKLELSDSVSVAIPLVKNAIEIPLGSSGFKFRIKPEVDIELAGKLTYDAKLTKSIGFEWDETKSGDDSKRAINETSVANFNVDAEVSLYIGLNLHPSLTWVSEKIFVVDIKEFGAGLLIKAKMPVISGEIKDEDDWLSEEKDDKNNDNNDDKTNSVFTEKTEKDICKLCFDIEASVVFKISAEIRIFSKKINTDGIDKNKDNSISFSLPNIHLGYFYLSLNDKNGNTEFEFGKGKCPHKKFQCTLKVTDKDTGEEISNTDIMIDDDKGSHIVKGNTGTNGIAKIWLAPGKYTISASSDGYSKYSEKKNLVYKGVREKGKDYGNESYSLYIDGKKTQDIQIKMDNTKYNVTVNVLDESNNPVNANIACSYTTKLSSALLKAAQQLFSTTFNGSKTFELPNGEHYFTITAPGYETSQQSVEVNNSDSVITVIMKPGSPTDISDEQTSTTITTTTTTTTVTTTVDSSLNIGDTGKYDLLSYKVMDDGNIEIIGCDTSAVNIIIPKTVEGRKVTSIGKGAFDYCKSFTTITIPDSVTSIGYDAFYHCTSLTSITIPDSVTSIGYDAFNGTPWLENKRKENSLVIVNNILIDGKSCSGDIVIPDSVTSIVDWAFQYCERLTSITIPDSVTSIGKYAFYKCTSLTSITIPDSITIIGGGAFEYCTSLTSITIPDSVTSIGEGAFSHCASLESIIIPDSVTSIGYDAFYGIPWLENKRKENSLVIVNNILIDGTTCSGDIVIPDSVTSINDKAFNFCASLESIIIPDSVTSIGEYAFSNCESLTSITIPDSVTSIGEGAFSHCASLTSITIPDSVTNIGDDAFYYCTSLTSVTIPNSVTSINVETFSYCASLTSITIPDSVTSIGGYAFEDCTSLTNVYYSGTEKQWNEISIGSYNNRLKKATIHYNSTGPEQTTRLIQYAPRAAEPTEILMGLWENTLYNVYAMNSRDAENRLSSDNLLYITQTTSDSNGNIDTGYIREKFPHAEIFAVCINGDKPTEQQSDIKVITVSGTGNSLNVPENALYISSDPSVAEIDKDGNITIVSEGYAAVIAVTDNGCEVVSVLDVNKGDKPPTTITTTTTTTSTTTTTTSTTMTTSTTTTTTTTISTTTTTISDIGVSLWGDANCDGRITVSDYYAIIQSLEDPDKYSLSSQGCMNADVYQVGTGVTFEDAKAIWLWLEGYIETIPTDYLPDISITTPNTSIAVITSTTTLSTNTSPTVTTTTTTVIPTEPPVVSYILGDVNGDGAVDASDASAVLAEYANLSTGGDGTFSDNQKSAGDVNFDNMIDASDASKILSFYAYLSTGGIEKDMMKWILL